MFKQTALITFKPDADNDARARLDARLGELAAAEFGYVGAALPVSHRGGDLVWHLHFADESTWRASGGWDFLDSIAADPAVADLDAAAYSVRRFAAREPGLRDGVYRTLFVGIEPSTPAPLREQYVEEHTHFAEYIPEILNWAMNETIASRGEFAWTHVWEQEFATVDGLVGPYMTNPYHWAFIDRWYDDEMPGQIVPNGALRHSASVLAASVIARYGA